VGEALGRRRDLLQESFDGGKVGGVEGGLGPVAVGASFCDEGGNGNIGLVQGGDEGLGGGVGDGVVGCAVADEEGWGACVELLDGRGGFAGGGGIFTRGTEVAGDDVGVGGEIEDAVEDDGGGDVGVWGEGDEGGEFSTCGGSEDEDAVGVEVIFSSVGAEEADGVEGLIEEWELRS
jgi:hypothetical protein